ncbi:MAG: hypothetical protein HYW80_01510 [Parcubacteria group bacterium]|nr:hypothetical protein [Parcubacteria group bacterium]
MSGYTQQDISRLVAGSARANAMKLEIGFVLHFVHSRINDQVHHSFRAGTEVCRIHVGEIGGRRFELVFRKPKRGLSIDLEELGPEPTACRYVGWELQLGAEQLSLVLVKPVHDCLPRVLDAIVELFPNVKERLDLLFQFAPS